MNTQEAVVPREDLQHPLSRTFDIDVPAGKTSTMPVCSTRASRCFPKQMKQPLKLNFNVHNKRSFPWDRKETVSLSTQGEGISWTANLLQKYS
jgi:hypothetical protein